MAITLQEYKQLRASGMTPEEIAKTPDKKRKGIIRKAGEFLGVEEFGVGIGRTLARGEIGKLEESQAITTGMEAKALELFKRGTPEQKARLKKILEREDLTAEAIEDIGTAGLTGKEVIGSAIQTGAGILSAGLPVAGTVRGAAGVGAGIGGVFGGAESLKKGRGIVSGAVKGAIIGGVTGGLLKIASNAIRSATKTIPKRFSASTLRQGRQDLLAEASGKKPVLSEQFLKKGLKGSEESIVKKSSSKLAGLEKQLEEHLQRNKNTFIDVPKLNRSLDEVVRRKRNVFGDAGIKQIQNFKALLKTKGARINVLEANQLKRDIYKELSEAAFNADVLPTNKEVLRTMASALRQSISRTSSLADRINAEEQFYIRVIDALEQQLFTKKRVNVIGLSDSIFASAGIASGEPVTGISVALGKRVLEGAQFKTRAAQRLSQLGVGIEKVPTETIRRLGRPIVGATIGKFAGE